MFAVELAIAEPETKIVQVGIVHTDLTNQRRQTGVRERREDLTQDNPAMTKSNQGGHQHDTGNQAKLDAKTHSQSHGLKTPKKTAHTILQLIVIHGVYDAAMRLGLMVETLTYDPTP